MPKWAVVAASVALGALAVWGAAFISPLLEPVQLPAIAGNWAERAAARGAQVQDQVGLRRSVLRHLGGQPAPEGRGPVRRLCLDLPEAYVDGVPPGTWVPDAEDLKWLTDQGLPFVSDSENCQAGGFPAVSVALGRPMRWWNQPAEVEVEAFLLYFTRPKSVPIIESHVLVMTHDPAGWRVVREEQRPVENPY